MRKLVGYYGIVIVSLMLAASPAYAQTSQGSGAQGSGSQSPGSQGPGTQGQSLLPEINPQDIEIRSQFRARFPGIRRQPILGFNPRPRIFRINPNRMPFIELPEQRAANLPVVGLQRPALSEYQPFSYADPGQAFARIGYGSLSSPLADVYLAPKPGPGKRTVYSGALHTRSSASHLDRQPGAFRNSDLSVRLLHKRKNHDLIDADLQVVSRFNYLPVTETADGVAVTSGSVVGANGDGGGADGGGVDGGGADGTNPVSSLVPGTERIRQEGFLFKGSYTQNTRSPLGWTADATWFGDRYERSQVGSGIADDSTADDGTTDDGTTNVGTTNFSEPFEAGGTVSLEYVRAGSRVEEFQNAQFYFDGGSVRSAAGNTALRGVTGLSAGVQRLLQDRAEAEVRLGAAFVFDDLDKNRIYPLADAMYRRSLVRNLVLQATLKAAPEVVRVADLRAQNRFYTIDEIPAHRYDVEARAELIGEPLLGTRWSADIFYGFTRNRPWFERIRGDVIADPADAGSDQPVTVWGGYTVRSDDARQFGASANVMHALADGTLWLDVTAYVQQVRFHDGGKIPFTESVGATASLSWSPVPKLVLRPELQFLGSRTHSEPDFRDLPAMVLLNMSAELRFSKQFGAFVELHHLTNQPYELWDGFEERPFQLLGGVRLQW